MPRQFPLSALEEFDTFYFIGEPAQKFRITHTGLEQGAGVVELGLEALYGSASVWEGEQVLPARMTVVAVERVRPVAVQCVRCKATETIGMNTADQWLNPRILCNACEADGEARVRAHVDWDIAIFRPKETDPIMEPKTLPAGLADLMSMGASSTAPLELWTHLDDSLTKRRRIPVLVATVVPGGAVTVTAAGRARLSPALSRTSA